jgi:acetylornithine/succinyldiaminopimelate/putrescine aminotransferase
VCLSKSLGGGLAKIGALLIKRSRYVEDFSIRLNLHVRRGRSTASAIALEALGLLDRDDLMPAAASQGVFLIGRAPRPCRPASPNQVQGRPRPAGSSLSGIRAAGSLRRKSYTLRALARQDYLGYVAAAYFLHAHDIRVAPSLGDAQTLRIEPSA